MRKFMLAAGVALMTATPFALQAASSNTSASVSIGDIQRYVKAEKYDRAISKAKEYLRSNPRSADAYNYLGYSERKLGNLDDAKKAYERALKIDANHVGAHEYYGELHITLGDLDGAEKHLAALTRICGNCAEQQELAAKVAKAKASG